MEPISKQYFVLDDVSNGATQILDNLSSIDQYFEVKIPASDGNESLQLQLTPKVDSQLAASVKSLEVELKNRANAFLCSGT